MSSKSAAVASGNALWSKIPKANAELFALTYGALVTELIRDYGEDNLDKINSQLDKMGYSIGMRCVDEFLAKNFIDVRGSHGSGGGGQHHHGDGPGGGGGGGSSGSPSIPYCSTFFDTAEVLAKSAFKMFLGITADVVIIQQPRQSSREQDDDNAASAAVEDSPMDTSEEPAGGGDGLAASDTGNNTNAAFSLILYDNPLTTFVELPDHFKDKLEYSIIYSGVIRGALEMLNMKVECTFVKSTLRGDDVNEIRVELQEVLQDGAGEDYQEE